MPYSRPRALLLRIQASLCFGIFLAFCIALMMPISSFSAAAKSKASNTDTISKTGTSPDSAKTNSPDTNVPIKETAGITKSKVAKGTSDTSNTNNTKALKTDSLSKAPAKPTSTTPSDTLKKLNSLAKSDTSAAKEKKDTVNLVKSGKISGKNPTKPSVTAPDSSAKSSPPTSASKNDSASKSDTVSEKSSSDASVKKKDSLSQKSDDTLAQNVIVPKVLTKPGNSQYYKDWFFFVGRDEESYVSFVFSFERAKNRDNDSALAKFNGWIAWKQEWTHLAPEEYPCQLFDSRIIPNHPSFDFRWPNIYQSGTFEYHYGDVFLNVIFNSPQPVYRASQKKGDKFDFQISNATLQGRSHEIAGVLLHCSMSGPLKLSALEAIRHEPKENGRFLFLNARFGESFLLWDNIPSPIATQSKAAVKIRFDGSVLRDTSEVDGISTAKDTIHLPEIALAWKWSVPRLDLNFELISQDFSEREESLRYHTLFGRVFHDQQYQRCSGILLDWRDTVEAFRPPIAKAVSSNEDSNSGAEVGADDGALPWNKKKKKKKSSLGIIRKRK